MLESHLPPQERASSLAQSYCDHASYFYRPVKKEELFSFLLPSAYSNVQPPPSLGELSQTDIALKDPSGVGHIRPHELATLFFIFALGALLDLNLPPYNPEAEHYYDLGRAALSLQAVYEPPSISTVQAMGLMATCHSQAGRKYSRDSAVRRKVVRDILLLILVVYQWCIMGFAAKLAQSVSCDHSMPTNYGSLTWIENRLDFVSLYSL
jgi:hypothetical protein